jgi:hypothetical protein
MRKKMWIIYGQSKFTSGGKGWGGHQRNGHQQTQTTQQHSLSLQKGQRAGGGALKGYCTPLVLEGNVKFTKLLCQKASMSSVTTNAQRR